LATTINTDVAAATVATTLDNDDNAPNIAREEQLESLLLQQNLERQLASSQSVTVTGSSTMSLSTSLLETDAILSLSTKQTHYLAKVMRILSKPKNNQNVLLRVFDGINGEWLCRVIPESSCTSNDAYTTTTPSSSTSGTSKSRKKSFSSNQSRNRSSLRIQCIQQLRPQIQQDEMPETPWLIFAPIKSKRMRLIIEKCTELGVGMFCPVVTEYTDSTAVAAYSAMIGGVELGEDGKCHNEHDFITNNHDSILYHGGSTSASASAKKQKSTDGESERLFVIACEAAEQCERLTIPKFVNLLEGQTPGMIITLHKFLTKWNQRQEEENNPRVLLVCRERSKERNNAYSLLEAMDRVAAWNKNVAFLVGPEGGWSPEEDSLLDRCCEDYPKSIMSVTLGSNVLRTETASILAVGSFSLWFDQKQMC
jgi:16S rRNA (uracil1498-N3)-methyltransferase